MTQERSPCLDIGGYVRDPAYHLMRLRMLLTGSNAPEDDVLRDALVRLNVFLEQPKSAALLSDLRGERKIIHDIVSEPRADGGVRIWSRSLKGLHLAGADAGIVWQDMLPEAIKTLLVANEGVDADDIISMAFDRNGQPYTTRVTILLKPLSPVN